MEKTGLLSALRANDERAIWAALDLTVLEGSWRWDLWNLDREKAIRLILRGGVATHVALSHHPDGRVREAAIRALPPSDESTLLTLLRRANDWVPIVAKLAGDRASSAIAEASEATLTDALPLVFALTRQGRVDHAVLIHAYLFEVSRWKGLARHLRRANRNGPLGSWAFRNLAGEEESPETIAREALRNAPPAVQSEAARHLVKDPVNWPLLMASPNPQIRRIGLDVAPELARETALTDPHAAVRNDARYLLGKRDHAAWYRNLLPAPGAISGLGETGAHADADGLRPLLHHEKPEVRRRAIEALARLLGADAEPELRNALQDPSRKVQRAAVEVLGRMSVAFDAEEIVRLNLERGSTWRLMEKVRRWEALLAALRHYETFPASGAWLVRWVERNLQTTPPRDDEATLALITLHEKAALLSPELFAKLREAMKPWLG